MPFRFPLLIALLFAALLLASGAAHGAPALPNLQVLAAEEEPLEAEAEEGDEVETACDTAYEEADEGELAYDEAEEICEEETDEDTPAARPDRAQPKHGAHRHKKTCRKRAAHKRHCGHRHNKDRQGGGFNSRARGGANGQAGRRTPTSE